MLLCIPLFIFRLVLNLWQISELFRQFLGFVEIVCAIFLAANKKPDNLSITQKKWLMFLWIGFSVRKIANYLSSTKIDIKTLFVHIKLKVISKYQEYYLTYI